MFDMNYQRDSTSGLEGLELIQRLRELDATVPIIALTAWGNVDLAVSAMKHGASDFIEKPWRNDALLEKVRSLIQRVRELRSSQRVSEYEQQDAQQLQTRIVPQRHLQTAEIEIFGKSTVWHRIPASSLAQSDVPPNLMKFWAELPDAAEAKSSLRKRSSND